MVARTSTDFSDKRLPGPKLSLIPCIDEEPVNRARGLAEGATLNRC